MLSHEPEPVADAEELAKRMAQAADMIDRIVVEALRQDRASQTLTDLREVTSEALIPDMDQPEKLEDFADMYAQTLSYGLFAARINHDPEEGDFERIGAAREIPKTNPFLRQLFDLITGADFEDEPYVGFVDDLVQLLANADIEAVLQDFGAVRRDNDEAEAAWQEDPVIHFYETFLKEYDPDLRRLRGVYYTPAPVVSYITRSVDHLLQEHFSLNGLVDRTTFTHRYRDDEGEIVEEEEQRVLVLDPACGTGTFLYHIVDHIRDQFRPDEAGMWNGYVEEHLLPRLFGFERMMAPYAVSHLKLGMQLAAQDLPAEERATWSYNFETDEDDYDDRLSIYLTDTLADPEEEIQQYPGPLRAVSEEAEAAAEVKNALPILAIVGNPPYSNFGQANSAPWVSDNLMMDWKPRGERKWNPDDFMKFMRWAEWKLNQTGQGVLAFITNRTYLDRVNRRRMRESLCDTFDSIYLLDLHGGIYETAPDEVDDHNVFDIRKGVAIVLFVKSLDGNQDAEVKYKSIWGDRDKKYNFLTNQDAGSVGWNTIDPEPPYYLFLPRDEKIADEYSESPKVQESFQEYTTGVQTNRDTLATDIHEGDLLSRIVEFSGASGSISEIEQKYDVSDVSYWRIREAQEELLE
jgi:predicted helicase